MKKNPKRKSSSLFNVANILDKKVIQGKPYYFIEWEDYPLSEATWEPLINLQSCLHLVKKFEKNLEKQHTKKDEKIIQKLKNLSFDKKSESQENDDKAKHIKKITFNETFFKHGSFTEGDKAKRIIFVKRDVNKKLLCAVEWEKKKDGTILKPTFYSNDEVKSHNPQILVDYYESKLKFLN